MKLLPVLLILVNTASSVVSNEGKKFLFPAILLRPDLEAIEKYYNKYDRSLETYLSWPDGGFFRIKRVVKENEQYLKIYGEFTCLNGFIFCGSYKNLYYKKHKFYFRTQCLCRPCIKTMKWFASTKKVSYSPPPTRSNNDEPFLSIRYFSITELAKLIEPFYIKNQVHLETAVDSTPATFLATALHPDVHFVEYTLWSEYKKTPEADGKLRVLLGSVSDNKVKLSASIGANRLVVNQYTHALYLRTNFSTEPLTNVFGVRMASVGFLAEVRSSGARMLSTCDLLPRAPNPDEHKISVTNLLRKVKTVEPKYWYRERSLNLNLRPSSVDFQVLGHLLVKKTNSKMTVESRVDLDEDCPLVIEYKTKLSDFLVGNMRVEKICTDDSKMWVNDVKGTRVTLSNEQVTLMNPKTSSGFKPKRRNQLLRSALPYLWKGVGYFHAN